MNNQSWNKVLIVDDEPTIRWVLAEALRGWDYETVESETGAATLAAIVTERPTAVLLDINLPDSSGLDLLREIKRRSPQTAVIMITVETLYENAVATLRGGADDFIDAEDFPPAIQPHTHDGPDGRIHSRGVPAARQHRDSFHFNRVSELAYLR